MVPNLAHGYQHHRIVRCSLFASASGAFVEVFSRGSFLLSGLCCLVGSPCTLYSAYFSSVEYLIYGHRLYAYPLLRMFTVTGRYQFYGAVFCIIFLVFLVSCLFIRVVSSYRQHKPKKDKAKNKKSQHQLQHQQQQQQQPQKPSPTPLTSGTDVGIFWPTLVKQRKLVILHPCTIGGCASSYLCS